MLQISELKASIEDKTILAGVDLEIKPGEVHAVMGPNGAGKSTLAEALMGHPNLRCSGSVKLDGKELLGMPADGRAKAGLFLAFQTPEEIEGVKVSHFIRKAISSRSGEMDLDRMMEVQEGIEKNAHELGMDRKFVSRELNIGFSGGEKKRLEVLQMLSLKPRMIILDEIDSGLDIDGIKVISSKINELNDGTRGFLIITHYPRILDYIKPDKVHILSRGRIVKSGDSGLARKIDESGYADLNEE